MPLKANWALLVTEILGGERKFSRPSDRKKDYELKVVIEVYLQDSEGKKEKTWTGLPLESHCFE